MLINNVELEELDIFDLETAEKYEKALIKVTEEAKETEGISMSASIRKQCNAVFNCFNTMFGEGTDKKIFGNKTNILLCLKSFEELIEHTNEQKKELEKLTNKYSPNRLNRRTKK
ncbi:AP endonuclease [Clostridium estertheticum]|uniref:DUF6673 family protein n=1 Tax=Clostridium estertheticum TaxID=238834 RepID=UPI0013EED940|nr:DUF6673 family protein [Clostridium estertheticum]MBZ9608633.1 AP endonuclease [Clostridium estertheticum]